MPFQQNSMDAAVDIHGDSNDVGRDQINLVVNGNGSLPISVTVAPSDRSFMSEQAQQQEDLEDTLKGVTQFIQEISELVSLDSAKHILAKVVTILSLLPVIRSPSGLNALVCSCKAICWTLVLATKDISAGHMGKALTDALTELEFSVDNIHSKLEAVLQHGISECAADLNTTSKAFSARLNMVCGSPLHQVCDLLVHSSDHRLIPDPPPPAPDMFFGREELARDIKDALLRKQNVALTGTGGIGKSSLAKSVINDEDIKKLYTRRFFISYESFNSMTITFDMFTQHIASALGLVVSGALSERQVKSNLASSPVLLVLDNAETLEEAIDQEKTRIASFISDIALTSDVTVILTSRTRNRARGIRWAYFNIPPLDEVSARQYFQTIYSGEMQEADIDALLGALDFHPLSIYILAYTAEENSWSGGRLLHEWQSQRTRLLQTGYGKENLGFTINLSLNSRSVQAFGDSLHVLDIIAFFPHGINEDYAARLFPSIPHILSILDVLRKVSLIYRSGPFLTMLAPVRLFLRDTSPTASLRLLWGIRQMYYDSLESLTAERDLHASLIVSDHVNMEHLIAFDIGHRQDVMEHAHRATRACYNFFNGLSDHKPRPTSLASIIPSLPEVSQTEKRLKAWCFESLGHLNAALSCYSYVGTTLLHARTLFLSVGDHDMVSRCTCNAARSFSDRGHFLQARQLVDDFIRSSSWRRVDEERKAEIYFVLDECRMNLDMSSLDANELFLRSTEHHPHDLGSHVLHWRARMLRGQTTPEEVQKRLGPFQSRCMSSSNQWDRWYFLGALAESEFLQRRYDAATQLLNQAHNFTNGLHLTLIVLRDKAAVASVRGDYGLARSILKSCLTTSDMFATPSSVHILSMRYLQGRNELYAGDIAAAHQHLVDVAAHCDACDEIGTKTLCTRALGEVALLLDRKAESDAYFSQTVQLCCDAGVPPALLGICKPMMRLDDDRFPGWIMFLETHTCSIESMWIKSKMHSKDPSRL